MFLLTVALLSLHCCTVVSSVSPNDVAIAQGNAKNCAQWAKKGHCNSRLDFMAKHCASACGLKVSPSVLDTPVKKFVKSFSSPKPTTKWMSSPNHCILGNHPGFQKCFLCHCDAKKFGKVPVELFGIGKQIDSPKIKGKRKENEKRKAHVKETCNAFCDVLSATRGTYQPPICLCSVV